VTPLFLTPLRLEQIRPGRWILLDDLVYRSAILGTIRVPKGFVTDLASVPRLPFAYWLAGGRGNAPAVVHDFLYRVQRHGNLKVSRSTADAVFYEALGAAQHAEPGWAATLMWLGVRSFGWIPWQRRDERARKLKPVSEPVVESAP
jgi:hypothetical protein